MGVTSGHGAEYTEGGRHGVTLPVERELQDILRVEAGRVGAECRAGRVLHPLVHGQHGEITGPAEPPLIEDRLEVALHARLAVLLHHHPLDVVGPG